MTPPPLSSRLARLLPGSGRGIPELPPPVREALDLTAHEKVLAAARDTDTGAWLIATTYAVALVDPSAVTEGGRLAVTWRRPWHEVDRASWERESSLLTVSWAGPAQERATRPSQWRLGEDALFLQVLRERVQASVVLAQELRLAGRRTGRAVIRQDLATGDLLEQVVLGRGVRDDAETEAAATVALVWLREQVGMSA
ncbi:MAG: hypothetical protein M3Y71_16290 [Actinomycetota bacterium]|nr:hypothetical protein [Actinomycetota bacterium]